MNKKIDFVIENGILKKYKGTESDIVIPDGVTEIGTAAFIEHTNIKSVTFPKSLERIGSYAFCVERPFSVFIPSGVKKIEVNAFFGARLSSIEVDPENPIYRSDNNCLIEADSKTLLLCCKDATIPQDGSIEVIGSCAFGDLGNRAFGEALSIDMSGMTFTVPEGVKEIQSSAFCFANLKMITLPDSLRKIGACAFMDCHELESVTVPSGVNTIGDRAFDDAWMLKSVTILGGKTEFGPDVFSDCDDLVIHAPAGSTAEMYANKYDIPFVAI